MTKVAVLDAQEAARKLVKRRWRELAARARALHKRRSRGHLHDFRVALRRLRAILNVCAEQLGMVVAKTDAPGCQSAGWRQRYFARCGSSARTTRFVVRGRAGAGLGAGA